MGYENLAFVESPEEKSKNWLKEKAEKFAENHSTFIAVLKNYGLWGFAMSNILGSMVVANNIAGDAVSVTSALAISAAGGVWGVIKGMDLIVDEQIGREMKKAHREFDESIKSFVENSN